MRINLTNIEDMDKCREHGRRVAAGYGAGDKDRSKELAIPDKNPIHDDPVAQAEARMAELAFVQAADLSVDDLDWNARCDGNHDIKLPGLTIDVKSSSHPRAQLLMWPVTKNHFIHKMADILVLAKVRARKNSAEVQLMGWTGKNTFLEKHEIAIGKKGIVDETKFMYRSQLNDMQDLFHIIKSITKNE